MRLALIVMSSFPKSKEGEIEDGKAGGQRGRKGRGKVAFIFFLHNSIWQTPLKGGFVYSITFCTRKMIKPLLRQRKR